MSKWLRDHFHHFVFPAMMAAEKLSTELPKPIRVQEAESAPKNLPSELRKLWSLCQDLGVKWSDDIKEHSNFGGSSIHRANAKLHGKILRSTLDSAVVAMRTERKSKLLLAGRDVWALAVIAEKRGIPYIFIPEISRHVAQSDAVKKFLEEKGVTGDELLIDTGFAGSIPIALEAQTGRKVPFRMMSQGDKYVSPSKYDSGLSAWGTPLYKPRRRRDMLAPANLRRPQQLFPNRKNARSEALETEYLAKYWKTGTTRFSDAVQKPMSMEYDEHNANYIGFNSFYNGKFADAKRETVVCQFLASRENIQRAAVLTSNLWRGVV